MMAFFKTSPLGILCLIFMLVYSGCGSKTPDYNENRNENDKNSNSDASTDGNASGSDSDSDADVDLDADSDSDSDTDVDIDSDTDIDSDSDGDTDAGDCIGPGQEFDSSDYDGSIAGICCPNLTPLNAMVWHNNDCLAPGCSCYVCTSFCGNNNCDEGQKENRCNCEVDCLPGLGGNECEDSGGICIGLFPGASCPPGTRPPAGNAPKCSGDGSQCCEAAPPSDCSGAVGANCIKGDCDGCWIDNDTGLTCHDPGYSCCLNMCNQAERINPG